MESGLGKSEFAGKKILMLLENENYKKDTRVIREARALVSAGYQVSVICPSPRGSKLREIIEGEAILYQYPMLSIGTGFIGYLWEYGYSMVMMFFLSLVAWIVDGFDILHAHNPPDVFFPLAGFYKLFGKKFVFDHHDLSPELYQARFGNKANRLIQALLRLFERMTCRLADHVITTNESYFQVEIERDGLTDEQITIVRNGPDLTRVKSVAQDEELSAKAGIILGYFGEIGPQDGVDYLLRALENLVYTLKRTDVFCIIVGEGDALAALQKLALELNLESFVQFTGWTSDEDFFRYLSTIDIGLDPDPSNPFNDRCTMTKMMEYMALGKPIVAFDLPEHQISAQTAALYARANDESEFAKQISLLIDNPELRDEMGQKGKERVEQKLAWSFQAEKLIRAFDSLTPYLSQKISDETHMQEDPSEEGSRITGEP